jgi:hypothetical protein
MKLRSWMMVLVATLLMQSANAAAHGGPSLLIDAAYRDAAVDLAAYELTGLQSGPGFLIPGPGMMRSTVTMRPTVMMRSTVMTRSTTALPVSEFGGGASSPDLGRLTASDTDRCPPGNCAKMQMAGFARAGERQMASSAYSDEPSESGEMSPLDIGLMLLFGAALVAYQLDRKQRLLNQSSLIAPSIK